MQAKYNYPHALPVLLYKFSEQTLQPGPTVSLKCIGKGNPPPRIKWLLDGFPIPQNQRIMVGQYVTIHDDVISHVNISSVVSSDGGLYACVAENSVGSVLHEARLNVYGSPHIRPIPIVKAIQGKDLRISCPVSGYPIQSILWQRDGYKLPSNGRQSVFENGTLVIREARKLEDEGYYTCSAFNPRDESHTGTIQIQVLSPPTIMPFLFPNKLLSEGMRSAVSCQILEGNLPIRFSWNRDGRPIGGRQPQIRSNFVSDIEGTTHVLPLNSAGYASYTTVLSVNVAPKWIRIPEDVHAVDGAEVFIHCEVEGYPKPNLSWNKVTTGTKDFLDSSIPSILSNGYHQFANGTFYISSADKTSEGRYTCTADNGVRSGISKTINLTVNSPPRFLEEKVHLAVRKGEKGILICEVAGDENIDILWRRNGMPISEGEDARYSIENHYTLYGSVSRFVISPILDQDAGPVTCEAVNQYGRDQKDFILSVEDIPSSPRGVRISNVGSRSLEIGWEIPHDGNSHILNYLVEYSNLPDERDKGEKQRRKMTAPGDAVNLIIQNLRPGTKYKFNVLAENRHGISSESHAVIIRTQEEPPGSPPRNVEVLSKSSTELRVLWTSPPISNWNSELLSYKIGYKEVGSNSGLQYMYQTSSSHLSESVLLTSLRKFTSYQIIIWPYNKEGIGPSSSTIVATTLEDVPNGPPTEGRCMSLSPSSLEVLWSKPEPEKRNGIIRGYIVKYYPMEKYYGLFRSLLRLQIIPISRTCYHLLRESRILEHPLENIVSIDIIVK
ncbi:DSCAM [Lepeophtheirus salmonis]|uniref:DSCAM n=1 Tax=Lepeophtheirus salmonis TaxID=72036 RepID=A0A7R8H9G0_LEPSM|nr:DSCAM [Lepeophtheirus salmonis]CAF2940559.1 DSCAM [Lepeophtheirus salmonis]